MKQFERPSNEKGGAPQGEVHRDNDDLAVFRWLDAQISNKKAVTACLLVLQGSACSGGLPGVGQAVGT